MQNHVVFVIYTTILQILHIGVGWAEFTSPMIVHSMPVSSASEWRKINIWSSNEFIDKVEIAVYFRKNET